MTIEQFVLANPSAENTFRSIVLFGRNVASYKFSLANALVEFASRGQEVIPISTLARPFSQSICEHLKLAPKQGTSSQSRFLGECSRFNRGEITREQLDETTAKLGFQNVIDAFHRVGNSDVTTRFFIDERTSQTPSIVLTSEMFKLVDSAKVSALQEIESRWRLVETAWELGATTGIIGFDTISGELVLPTRRRAITSARPALNGYQKGKCFYCYRDISIEKNASDLAEVDHLFPHVLERRSLTSNLDGVWNLVLACQSCNRGANGKFDSTPAVKYVDRLSRRNEYLILSHHPLKETLLNQTGHTPESRRQFLQEKLRIASTYQAVPWSTNAVDTASF